MITTNTVIFKKNGMKRTVLKKDQLMKHIQERHKALNHTD